jgi:hypothetical protein
MKMWGKEKYRRVIHPEVYSNKNPAPTCVPTSIANDYNEARAVLPISPNAGAALARRCLQNILSDLGYAADTLFKQIEAAINDSSGDTRLSRNARENLHALRKFGNFGAHPPTATGGPLSLLDVEPDEAEWCIETIYGIFKDTYEAEARNRDMREKLENKTKNFLSK